MGLSSPHTAKCGVIHYPLVGSGGFTTIWKKKLKNQLRAREELIKLSTKTRMVTANGKMEYSLVCSRFLKSLLK